MNSLAVLLLKGLLAGLIVGFVTASIRSWWTVSSWSSFYWV